jgi:hypothetical protein
VKILLILASLIYSNNSFAHSLNALPPIILWAWERPEDLRFLENTNTIGVAFLAQTLQLTANTIHYKPRQQPLKISPNTALISVTRIETLNPALTNAQSDELIARVLKTLTFKNISAVQIDFDAKVSERKFYQQFLIKLRSQLPPNIALSITALASFCLGDTWIETLPVAEAIPMLFRMGRDTQKVKRLLNTGHDFSIALCQHSYGIASDEPILMNYNPHRRRYFFKTSSMGWQQKDIARLGVQ